MPSGSTRYRLPHRSQIRSASAMPPQTDWPKRRTPQSTTPILRARCEPPRRHSRPSRFYWGNDVAAAAAHAWYKDNSGGQTHPAASKPANPFGLFDMAGDVWQWTEDCYAETYAAAPADGSAAAGAGCLRVDRGGSWFYPAWLLRPATRERNPAGYRDTVMGFRLARTL